MADSSGDITISRRSIQRVGITALAVIAIALIVGLGITVIRDHTSSSSDAVASSIDSSTYQAVFLTNGEIYFGKLSASGGDFDVLTHVYRLTAQAASQKGKPLQRTLVKMTSDVHQPRDGLVVNRRQILYVENLNPTGRAALLMKRGG